MIVYWSQKSVNDIRKFFYGNPKDFGPNYLPVHQVWLSILTPSVFYDSKINTNAQINDKFMLNIGNVFKLYSWKTYRSISDAQY